MDIREASKSDPRHYFHQDLEAYLLSQDWSNIKLVFHGIWSLFTFLDLIHVMYVESLSMSTWNS